MATIDHLIDALARRAGRRHLTSAGPGPRRERRLIASRLARGLWQPLQAGVYLVGSAPPTWDATAPCRGPGRRTGCRGLAPSGDPAVGNVRPRCRARRDHGAALRSADRGRRDRPSEPRRVEPPVLVGGLPTSSVERTLARGRVRSARSIVVEKATASAVRLGLTTETKVDAYLRDHAGKGRRGVTKLREATGALRAGGGGRRAATGRSAFLRELRPSWRRAAERQVTDRPGRGHRGELDFAWPARWKAVEFVGWWSHSDPRAPRRRHLARGRHPRGRLGPPSLRSVFAADASRGRRRRGPPLSGSRICASGKQIATQNDEEGGGSAAPVGGAGAGGFLVEALRQVEALEHELDGGGDGARGLASRPARRPTGAARACRRAP